MSPVTWKEERKEDVSLIKSVGIMIALKSLHMEFLNCGLFTESHRSMRFGRNPDRLFKERQSSPHRRNQAKFLKAGMQREAAWSPGRNKITFAPEQSASQGPAKQPSLLRPACFQAATKCPSVIPGKTENAESQW